MRTLCEDLVLALRHKVLNRKLTPSSSYRLTAQVIKNKASISATMTIVVHDVLIVGTGPAGLAIAARLREPTPSAVFTDAEHDRYHWVKKYSGRMNLLPRSGSARSKCSSTYRRNQNRHGSPCALSEDHR